MAGFGALAILGGAMQGAGRGMVDQAEARRQERLEAIRRMDRQQERTEDREFTLARDESNRDFTREQTVAGQEFQRDVRAEDRDFTLSRDAAGRDFTQSEREAGLEGQRGLLRYRVELAQESAGPPTGMDAEEGRLYDEIRSQYFYRDGTPNEEAGGLSGFIRHLRSIPSERGGRRFNQIADQLAAEIGGNTTPTERETARLESEAGMADQARRDTREEFGGFLGFQGGSREERARFEANRLRELQGGQSAPAQGERTASTSGGQAGDGPPPAPRDVEQRVAGQVYQAPDGRLVEWTGQGWRLVEG